jgi:hypothetical protein
MRLHKKLLVKDIGQWIENECKGNILVEMDGRSWWLYARVASADRSWSRLMQGAVVDAEIWFERAGELKKVSDNILPLLEATGISHYEIAGEVLVRDAEMIMVRSVIDIPLDMNVTKGDLRKYPAIDTVTPGDRIVVKGLLKAGLHI